MEGKIWLIGGTSESVTIAKILVASKISLVVTVTTQTAQFLYPSGYDVAIGCMDRERMQSFCQEKKIRAVVDASHPYAVEVSLKAIAVTQELNLPYLRYERANGQSLITTSFSSSIIELDSFTTLFSGEYLNNQRVLLTVGCKALPLFKSWQNKATLFARILPKILSLKIALAAGFTSDRLIAIRPPISFELETLLWRQWNISLVITKASGKAGGEDLKRQVAADLNIPLIVIARPQVDYPRQTSTLQEVLAFSTYGEN